MKSDRDVSRTLERISLKDQVLRELKANILTGGLEPAKVLTIGTFAEQMGVSYTPVREALLDLESQGLVEIMPNIGFQVTTPSEQELRNMFEIRELLEVPTIGKIAGKLSTEVLQVADELCRKTQEAAEREHLAEYLELDVEFHVFLIEQGGNHRLARIVEGIRQTHRMPALRSVLETGSLRERGHEHREILDAVANGDRETAIRLTQKHLDLTRRELNLE